MKTIPTTRASLLALAVFAAAGPTVAADTAITIYPDGAALVSDSREMVLEQGRQTVHLSRVAEGFRPGTLWLAGKDVQLLASSFHDAPQKVDFLRRRVGEGVTLLRPDGSGGDVMRRATLLAASGTPVVRVDDRVEWLGADSPWRIALADVPASQSFAPTLALTLIADHAGRQKLDLIYQTEGLSWSAVYVARLGQDAEQLSIRALASLHNRSGRHWRDVVVSLIAGQVNRAYGAPRLMARRMVASAAAAPDMEAEAVGDYYRYTLDEPVTLAPDEQRNVLLFDPQTIAVERQYRLEGGWHRGAGDKLRTHASIRLKFINELGRPLPAGTMRVYNSGKPPLLLGEAHIANTPEGGRVTLLLGKAFDITAERVTTDSDRDGDAREIARRITVYNAKDETVQVRVVERVPGDWKMLSETRDHERVDAQRVAWTLSVPAGGSTELAYRVRYR